jgi:membrane-bound ClpP family serine protease
MNYLDYQMYETLAVIILNLLKFNIHLIIRLIGSRMILFQFAKGVNSFPIMVIIPLIMGLIHLRRKLIQLCKACNLGNKLS